MTPMHPSVPRLGMTLGFPHKPERLYARLVGIRRLADAGLPMGMSEPLAFYVREYLPADHQQDRAYPSGRVRLHDGPLVAYTGPGHLHRHEDPRWLPQCRACGERETAVLGGYAPGAIDNAWFIGWTCTNLHCPRLLTQVTPPLPFDRGGHTPEPTIAVNPEPEAVAASIATIANSQPILPDTPTPTSGGRITVTIHEGGLHVMELPSRGWGCEDCGHNHTGQYVPSGVDPATHDGRCIEDAYPSAHNQPCRCRRRRPRAITVTDHTYAPEGGHTSLQYARCALCPAPRAKHLYLNMDRPSPEKADGPPVAPHRPPALPNPVDTARAPFSADSLTTGQVPGWFIDASQGYTPGHPWLKFFAMLAVIALVVSIAIFLP